MILQKRAQTYWAQSQADSAAAQNIPGVHHGRGSAPEDRRAAGVSRCTAETHPGGLAMQGHRGKASQVGRTVQTRHGIYLFIYFNVFSLFDCISVNIAAGTV